MTSKTASKVNESDTGKPILSREALERVADLFRVFSEATRLAILQSLMSGTKSVNELVEELSATQANISKQLRVLYDAKILAREKRGNQVFYSIDDDIVRPLCELVCGKLNRDIEQAQNYEFSI
ncbi:MAG: DNA-binding transcriptional ArsR family regulator [Verrucomicrobiales bacterium]|jgi:DNA-binding transcriptional ArsR family regulator